MLLNSISLFQIPHVVIQNIGTISDPATFDIVLTNITEMFNLFFETDKTNMELVLNSIQNSNVSEHLFVFDTQVNNINYC